MTASSYRGIPVSKAGERFGLSLTDLEELFGLQDQGSEKKGDFFNLPLKEVQFTEKGRGGVLGYKAARTPSILKTFGAQEGGSVNISNVFSPSIGSQEQPTSTPAIPKPKINPLRSFIDPILGDPTGAAIGLSGVQRAMEAGLTPSDIRSRAQEEGLSFGEKAAAALGVGSSSAQAPRMAGAAFASAPSSGPSLSSFISSEGTAGSLGLAAVERARSSGLTDAQIRQMAQQQGLNFGEKAAASLR